MIGSLELQTYEPQMVKKNKSAKMYIIIARIIIRATTMELLTRATTMELITTIKITTIDTQARKTYKTLFYCEETY